MRAGEVTREGPLVCGATPRRATPRLADLCCCIGRERGIERDAAATHAEWQATNSEGRKRVKGEGKTEREGAFSLQRTTFLTNPTTSPPSGLLSSPLSLPLTTVSTFRPSPCLIPPLPSDFSRSCFNPCSTASATTTPRRPRSPLASPSLSFPLYPPGRCQPLFCPLFLAGRLL